VQFVGRGRGWQGIDSAVLVPPPHPAAIVVRQDDEIDHGEKFFCILRTDEEVCHVCVSNFKYQVFKNYPKTIVVVAALTENNRMARQYPFSAILVL
jgi:hypothetical protein